MSNSALFAGLSAFERAQIAQGARMRVFIPDEFVFSQGQPIRQVLLIESGCVKLTQLNSNGNEVILWLHGSRDAVGVFGIPAKCLHTCSARVIERCRALVWDWSKLEGTPMGQQLRENISLILSERMRELEERFREIATEKVSKRVAFALVRISSQVGKRSPGGVEVCLSREELAQLTGTTLFTISRLMSKWAEHGLVQPRREAVLVRDPQRLLDECDSED
jgi:CRP-like cAMP-binding protein